MANLLRIVLALAEDPDARRALRDDPDGVLDGLEDLCAEDVAAAVDVVRHQVAPDVADRLSGVMGMRPGPAREPAEAGLRMLLAVGDAVDGPGADPAPGGREVPARPPGPDRSAHLWAIDGRGGAEAPAGADDERDARTAPLASVPDPPGGFEFSPLELVLLPSGLPDEGIEPGALATVVAVHRQPELHYEIEVSGDDGARRFLGPVPPSSLDRYTG